MEFLDAHNSSDAVKKIVKSYFWKTKDELLLLIQKNEQDKR